MHFSRRALRRHDRHPSRKLRARQPKLSRCRRFRRHIRSFRQYHIAATSTNPPRARVLFAEQGRIADTLFFACGPDHKRASDGDWETTVTDTGRLAWTDETKPPEINHAHHPEELLRGDPDPPDGDEDADEN